MAERLAVVSVYKCLCDQVRCHRWCAGCNDAHLPSNRGILILKRGVAKKNSEFQGGLWERKESTDRVKACYRVFQSKINSLLHEHIMQYDTPFQVLYFMKRGGHEQRAWLNFKYPYPWSMQPLKKFSSWHFQCIISSQVKTLHSASKMHSSKHAWVIVKADLDTTHHISELQRICCMCAPAFQQRWAIHQTLADQTKENSYLQYLKKETMFCELYVTHQSLSRLIEHNPI